MTLEIMRARLAELEERGELADGEYSMTQEQLVLLASLVANLKLDAFLARIERADALTPMLDPTLWMRGGAKLAAVRRLALAAKGLRDEVLRQARDELAERERAERVTP